MAGFMGGSSGRGITSETAGYTASPLHLDGYVTIENTQVGRQDYVTRPTGTVSSDVWDFEIPPQGEGVYINMSDMVIHGKAKVTKKNGTAMGAGSQAALINNFGMSAFKSVEAKINDLSLPGSSFTDAHIKGYINTIINTDFTMKNQLEAQIFHADKEGSFNTLTEANNSGYKARKAIIKESREFDFTAPISCDFLKSGTFLGPGNKLSLKFYRASDEELLMSTAGDDLKITFTSLNLLYSRVIAVDRPMPKNEVHLIQHTELMRFPMIANTTNIRMQVQKGGRLPRAVYIFFVSTAALNGRFDLNMFRFEHLDISSINLRVNGRSVPADPLQPDFDKKLVSREISHAFQNMGIRRTGVVSFINRKRFLDGYTIFPFDLTPDKCCGEHLHETYEGTLEVEARCSGMNNATTGFAYMVWDMEVSIDRTMGMPGRHSLAYVSQDPH